MKNLNKVLALVIVLAMAFSTVAFAGYSDVAEDASYAEAVEVMSALGLLAGYEDGTFGPDKTITRAEFAAVVVRALGMEASAQGAYGETGFSDVAADAWYAGYVMIASQQGIVNGYPDGTFRPENPVKFEEAVKMIMCTLNYQKKFEKVENAYPTAYIAEAHTTGITLGANLSIGSEASRAIVARLVYNALTVGKMRQTAFGTEDQWAVPTNAYTLLSENLSVARIEGSISSVKFDGSQKLTYKITAVAPQYDSGVDRAYYYYPNTPLAKKGDEITMKYADGVNLIKHYATIAYVDVTDSANPVVLAVVEKPGANETLTITSTQAKDGVYTDNTSITYYKTSSETDSQATTVKLSGTSATYANGDDIYTNLDTATTAATTFAANYSAGAYPVVTLIDNDANNAGYEVIVAEAYYAGVVEEINERSYRISFEVAEGLAAKSNITLNPVSDEYAYNLYDETGAKIAFEDIKVGDVLNVFTSKDENTTNYEVYVNTTKVEGSISEQKDAEHFVIDGTEYYSYVDLLSGDSGIFYVDKYNKILKFELSEDSNRNFGVLYAVYQDSSNPLETEPKAVIYTADGQFAEYAFAKNVNINTNTQGVAYKQVTLDAIKASYSNNAYSVLPAGQEIVMYTVNGAGLISELYWDARVTGQNGVTGINGISERDDRYDSDSHIYSDNDTANDTSDDTIGDSYRENASRLGSATIPEDFTFAALELKNYQTTVKKTEWSTVSMSILNEDGEYFYDMVYNKDSKNIVFGVLFDCKAKVAGDDAVMLVRNVGTTTNSEGVSAQNISGWVDGMQASVIATSGDVVLYDEKNVEVASTDYTTAYATIAKGALIQYSGEGEAAAIRILVTADEMAAIATGSGNFTEMAPSVDGENDDKDGYLVYGKMTEYSRGTAEMDNGTLLTVPTSTPTTLLRFTTSGNTTVVGNIYGGDVMAFGVAERDNYLYGDATATPADTNADKVVIYSFDGEAKAAVILDADNDDIWN